VTGINARVRAWWLGLVSEGGALPSELVGKIRLVEGTLPIIGRLIGLGRVGSMIDLLPEDDETTAAVLQMLHDWTGRMLHPADVIDGESHELPSAELPPATT
jgi:hypothetical protein